MALERAILPPPDPECMYCNAKWRRLHEDSVFHDEVSHPCKNLYETYKLVHIAQIMPDLTWFDEIKGTPLGGKEEDD